MIIFFNTLQICMDQCLLIQIKKIYSNNDKCCTMFVHVMALLKDSANSFLFYEFMGLRKAEYIILMICLIF